jgi:hypothetical protein
MRIFGLSLAYGNCIEAKAGILLVNRKMICAALAVAGALVTASTANAGLILSSDFDDRAVSGATASNITWATNGVSSPGDLTADFSLFNTSAAQDRIAVDRNLHNEGSWTAKVNVDVQENLINLGFVSLEALIFSNSGALQPFGNTSRDLDISVSFLDSSNAAIATKSVSSVYAAGGAWTPKTVSFDFTGTTLAQGASYFLAITASGEGPGNNAGFDNLRVAGTIPTPAPLALLGLGLLMLARRKS